MRRLFWMAVGAGIAIYVMRRADRLIASVMPPALADRLARRATKARGAAGRFVREARAGMTERENELTPLIAPGDNGSNSGHSDQQPGTDDVKDGR